MTGVASLIDVAPGRPVVCEQLNCTHAIVWWQLFAVQPSPVGTENTEARLLTVVTQCLPVVYLEIGLF